MSCRKHFSDKFHGNELTVSKSRLSFISPERVDIITEPKMFIPKIFELLLLLYYTFMIKARLKPTVSCAFRKLFFHSVYINFMYDINVM